MTNCCRRCTRTDCLARRRRHVSETVRHGKARDTGRLRQRLRSVNDRAGVGCRSVDHMKQRSISSRLCSRSIGEPITQTEAHQQWRLGFQLPVSETSSRVDGPLFSARRVRQSARCCGVKVRFRGAPWKGGAFQWVRVPPGRMLQPEATGAAVEVTKQLKPSVTNASRYTVTWRVCRP
jgi:hypothetical protein